MEFSGREDADNAGAGSPHTPLHRSIPTNGLTGTPVAAAAAAGARRQYHECLRNHAAAAGGHVVDGCCEFMPSSPEHPLTCAACECHRSFHRRDPSPGRASAGPQPPPAAARCRQARRAGAAPAGGHQAPAVPPPAVPLPHAQRRHRPDDGVLERGAAGVGAPEEVADDVHAGAEGADAGVRGARRVEDSAAGRGDGGAVLRAGRGPEAGAEGLDAQQQAQQRR